MHSLKLVFSSHVALWMVFSATAIHVLCCGLPLLLSIGTIASLIGLGSGGVFHPAWFDAYEERLLMLSASILAITGLVQFISYRLDCRRMAASHCHHAPCDKKKRLARNLYGFAVALFAINLIIFALSH
jgi:hypothetical protein